MEYTVGRLAKLSGLTVRTLHHYESLGLLKAGGRSEAGYRRYGEDDVLVLHRILAYRQIGLPLKEIAPLLRPDAPSLPAVLARQIASVEAEVARQQRLLAMLRRLARRAEDGGAGLADRLLTLMSTMRACERHLAEADVDELLRVQASIGDADLKRMRAEYDRLMPRLRAAMERGTDPGSRAVRAMARRLIALGEPFERDTALRDKMRAMLASEPGLQRDTGITPALVEFIDRAVAAVRQEAAP